jgi:hypothetical protein
MIPICQQRVFASICSAPDSRCRVDAVQATKESLVIRSLAKNSGHGGTNKKRVETIIDALVDLPSPALKGQLAATESALAAAKSEREEAAWLSPFRIAIF